jgi:non-heme chloroperoxidase
VVELKQGRQRVADDVELSYFEGGSGGRPLVMLPGLSAPVSSFRKQLPVFAEQHRVIALDPRGHGFSDKPSKG